LTIGKNADAGLTISRHFGMYFLFFNIMKQVLHHAAAMYECEAAFFSTTCSLAAEGVSLLIL
jgi:hypothetical protein